MIVVFAATLAALGPMQSRSADETWDALAREYETCFEDWVAESERLSPSDKGVEWSPARFQPRFLALAERGEGRAVLWLLASLDPAQAPRVLELVERGGEAAWVGSALHWLGVAHARFDAARLTAILEKHVAGAKDPSLRIQAALARACSLADTDPHRASDLRVWAAMLSCDGVDAASEGILSPERLDALTLNVLAMRNSAWNEQFEQIYYDGPGSGLYVRAGAPPDPDDVWRPVIEELARRGERRAQFWTLVHGPHEVDEAGKQRLLSYFDAVTSAPLMPDELEHFGDEIDSLVGRFGVETVEPRVRRLVDQSPDEDRACLLFRLGDALCNRAGGDPARRERGVACLREVEERWPDSKEGIWVKGRLFRYTKLLVGMRCPDFETVDADGSAFKLSDYEGKVTVVVFWGSW